MQFVVQQTPCKRRQILHATADLNIKFHLKENMIDLILKNMRSRSIHQHLQEHRATACTKDIMLSNRAEPSRYRQQHTPSVCSSCPSEIQNNCYNLQQHKATAK